MVKSKRARLTGGLRSTEPALYDTESSTYITLDRLAAMIREGRDFEVVDANPGEDITHQVLTQIIVDEEFRGSTLFPINFLRQLIGLYGNQMQNLVPPILEAAMDAFRRTRGRGGCLRRQYFRGLAKRNMAMFEDAAQAIACKPPKMPTSRKKIRPRRPSTTASAELAELQAKVDRSWAAMTLNIRLSALGGRDFAPARCPDASRPTLLQPVIVYDHPGAVGSGRDPRPAEATHTFVNRRAVAAPWQFLSVTSAMPSPSCGAILSLWPARHADPCSFSRRQVV